MLVFYDFEVFAYDWLVVCMKPQTKETVTIINSPTLLKEFYEANKDNIWVGYNSRHYDQYILKAILCQDNPNNVNAKLISGDKGWQINPKFNQIKLNNFDIKIMMNESLKQLEGFMGSSIEESSVPFNINRKLTKQELEEVIQYCKHDVEETIKVFLERKQEFDSMMSILKTFDFPIEYINKTKAQIASIILNAERQPRKDEFDISVPKTLRLNRYKHIAQWYLNPINHDYDKKLKTEVSGIEHTFAWGGIHAGKEKYHTEGIILACDVASLYPAIMLEYNTLSRNVSNPKKYRQLRDDRLVFKKQKDPRQLPYKIVLNSTFGASKDKYNNLYDPRNANLVCVYGQLLLLDLIEKLEPHWELIQSNTDGLFGKVKCREDIPKIKEIAAEWEKRTHLDLEWEEFTRIYQKDVNNYIIIDQNNKYKSKGAWLKKLNSLDNDLPIVNEALVEHLVHGTPIEKTILNCNELIKFQKISKISNKYRDSFLANEAPKRCKSHKAELINKEILGLKCFRVFASKDPNAKGLYKIKRENGSVSKIENTPEKLFIDNSDMTGKTVPDYLDKQWYIDLAKERLGDICGN